MSKQLNSTVKYGSTKKKKKNASGNLNQMVKINTTNNGTTDILFLLV
jgi:hypothetical protein